MAETTRFYGQPRIRSCCSGMGIVHASGWGGTRAVNPFDGVLYQAPYPALTKSWPCWAVPFWEAPITFPYLGQQAGGAGLKAEWRNYPYHVPYHYLGYNIRTGAMINAYPSGHVCSLELRGCHVDSTGTALGNPDGAAPGYEGGISPNFLLSGDDDDWPDFLESTLESTDGFGGAQRNWAAWSGATHERLYGHTQIWEGTFPTGDSSIKLWSVKHDLTDYQVAGTIDMGGGFPNPAILNSHVCAGKHFATGLVTGTGYTGVRIYEDGLQIAEMTPAAAYRGAIGVVKDQRLLVAGLGSGYGGYTGLMVIVTDGADPADCKVVMRARENHPVYGERDKDFYPVSIAWDPLVERTVVQWMPYYSTFGASITDYVWWSGFLTYIHEPLEPGNILDQMDKISLYMNWACPGYGYQQFDSWWSYFYGLSYGGFSEQWGWVAREAPNERGVVIPGALPTPMTVTPGDVPVIDIPPETPSPPPPPEVPNCDAFNTSDCPDPVVVGNVSGFDNFFRVETDVGIPFGDLLATYTGYNLNLQGVTLEYDSGSSFSRYKSPLYRTSSGNYGEGYLVKRYTVVDTGGPNGEYVREWWMYQWWIDITCSDGQVTVSDYFYDTQVFEKYATGDPMSYIGDEQKTPGEIDTDLQTSGEFSQHGSCSAGYFQSPFKYETPTQTGEGDGSRYYAVMASLGGVPGAMPP